MKREELERRIEDINKKIGKVRRMKWKEDNDDLLDDFLFEKENKIRELKEERTELRNKLKEKKLKTELRLAKSINTIFKRMLRERIKIVQDCIKNIKGLIDIYKEDKSSYKYLAKIVKGLEEYMEDDKCALRSSKEYTLANLKDIR